jgi:predicted porin
MKFWAKFAVVPASAMALAAPVHAAGPILYGNIDVGVTHATGTPHGSSTQLTAGNDFPDQIGFRGSEALGGGNSVIYNVATGFCGAGAFAANGLTPSLPSNGYCTGGGFMQRTSLLGLKGGFGQVIAGRFLMPVYTDAVSIDPFRNGTPAAITSLNRAVSAFNYLRESQLIEYKTPDLGGLTAQLVYGLGGATGSNQAGRLTNLSVHYRQGPLYVGAAYLFNYYDTTSALESGKIPVGAYSATHVEQLFGHYDFGVLTLSAMVQRFTSGFPGSAFTPVKAVNAPLDNRFWMVGAAVPVGAGQFSVSYSHTSNQEVAFSDASMVGLGYSYSLSKSTMLYTGVSHISNGSASAYGVHDASNTFVGSYGQAANGIDLGIRHSF